MWLTCIHNGVWAILYAIHPLTIGTFTGGSGSMETAAVNLLNSVLHAAVSQIIAMIKYGNDKHL